jgi:hypothetical protein
VPTPDIDWIPAGTRFGADDMVFFAGRGERDLDDVLADIDLVVTGPHASSAFPEELAPFVDARLTRRLQYDFTDVSTSPVARRWAELDRRVLYIEDPHPRAVRDANRPRPADPGASLRQAFQRIRAAGEAKPDLGGVDAIRPVTFGLRPVYVEPADDAGWNEMIAAFETAGRNGVDRYERLRDELIERVVEAKLRRLATLDPTTTSPADWTSATTLDHLSIHDTMNHTARADGAISVERAPADRLPNVVALSNRGDAAGEISISEDTSMRSPEEVPTMRPGRLRRIAAAYRDVFDAGDPGDVAFNRPYLGGHETQVIGPRLRELEPLAVVRSDDGPARQLRLGSWQNEFLREFLLGAEATADLTAPGDRWTGPPPERIEWLAERLHAAHDQVRRSGETED